MLAPYLLLTFLPCTLSATLPSQTAAPPTHSPPPKLTSSPPSLTTTPSSCWDPPHPRIWIYPAHFRDCERAAAGILRNIDASTAVIFSRDPRSGFRLPADYHYRSCWISLNIDPGEADEFEPQVAYIAAWDLARECTSVTHRFGGRRTVGPRDKVFLYINGECVPGVGEEAETVGVGVGNWTTHVAAKS
ncbi:hypothetical protein HO173_012830 [Letharia columbiana]|uniref:Uncharacterized protein n=1 Tax=Letharia columbiana TaxID=112416 RepID=A0A8H6FEP1_9LECA|nr:uncharacterized protein HO173_012830 [Letharia columbiana]KAF6225306.1 hypothetical protein HO173_012830 [Letharia columbiana]